MTTVTRIHSEAVEFALSPDDAQDLQWLIENGRRWSSQPAHDHIAHCRALKADIAATLSDAVRRRHALDNASEAQTAFVIEVDPSTDTLPWELVDLGNGPIGLTGRSVVREPIAQREPKSESATLSRLRILLVIARPYSASDVPYLAVSRHVRALLRQYPERFDVTVLRPATYDALQRALSVDRTYDVVHFDGHGDVFASGPVLTFEDERGGPIHIPASDLTPLIRDSSVRLVVLNACRSAQSPGPSDSIATDSLESSLAYAIASTAGISVVAMRYAVRADIAGRFVGTFYRVVLRGLPVSIAVQQGRQHIAHDPPSALAANTEAETEDWLLPVCYGFGDAVPIARENADIAIDASADALASVRSIEGRDLPILLLEKAFLARRIPFVCGQIGAGKVDLAHAFGEWFQMTSGSPTDVADITLRLDGTGILLEADQSALLAHLRCDGRVLVVRVECDCRIGDDQKTAWLAALSASLIDADARSIVVMDGDWAPHVSGHPYAVVHVPPADENTLAVHAAQVRPGIGADALEPLIASANGNVMFARVTAHRADPASTIWAQRVADVIAASGAQDGLLECLSCFALQINIFALRHMMHELGFLPHPKEFYLPAENDDNAQERHVLHRFVVAGLMSRPWANVYELNPWLASALTSKYRSRTATPAHRRAFARSIADTCHAYCDDYFIRGERESAYLVHHDIANIRAAWSILEAEHDYAALVNVFSGLTALWTMTSQHAAIEETALRLRQTLRDGHASIDIQDQLLMLRLPAIRALGRLNAVADDIRAYLDRRIAQWDEAGRPTGTVNDMPGTYFNMLSAKQNWAATLRDLNRVEAHRAVCLELVEQWAAAEYGEGVIKAIMSLAHAAGSAPSPKQSEEVYRLFHRHFAMIRKTDKILQSEVLGYVAMHGMARFADRSDPAFAKSIEEAVHLLETALTLLPAGAASNRANLLAHLAECYARLGIIEKMDESFHAAIDLLEHGHFFDRASLTAANAAQCWKWLGNVKKSIGYVNAARQYLSQAEDNSNTRAARDLLSAL